MTNSDVLRIWLTNWYSGLRTYHSKYGSLLCWVAKGVDVPSYTRSGVLSKVVFHKLESESHLVDDGIVVGGSLIVHAPASIDKFQLLVLHQFLHLCLCLRMLFVYLYVFVCCVCLLHVWWKRLWLSYLYIARYYCHILQVQRYMRCMIIVAKERFSTWSKKFV